VLAIARSWRFESSSGHHFAVFRRPSRVDKPTEIRHILPVDGHWRPLNVAYSHDFLGAFSGAFGMPQEGAEGGFEVRICERFGPAERNAFTCRLARKVGCTGDRRAPSGNCLRDARVPLTDTTIRKAKPAEREYKLADSGGLYLLVSARHSRGRPTLALQVPCPWRRKEALVRKIPGRVAGGCAESA
jgi:hypothetical protein